MDVAGGRPIARRLTCRATDRYRSRCAVEIDSASARLSKLPSAVSSPGRSGLASKSSAEQIANGVGVLGAIEPMDRADPARVRSCGPRAIDVALENGRDRTIRGGIRPRPARRRHRARAKLADHALPGLRVGAWTGRVQGVERQSGRAQPLVVAGDAVLFEEGAGWRGRGVGCGSDCGPTSARPSRQPRPNPRAGARGSRRAACAPLCPTSRSLPSQRSARTPRDLACFSGFAAGSGCRSRAAASPG